MPLLMKNRSMEYSGFWVVFYELIHLGLPPGQLKLLISSLQPKEKWEQCGGPYKYGMSAKSHSTPHTYTSTHAHTNHPTSLLQSE